MIEKIFIKGFGKFKDYQLDFSKGLNVLYGLNEAGKTTLIKFIHYMFYGMKKNNVKKKLYIDDYYHYKPWQHEAYGGIIIYSMDNIRYRIERNFIKENDWVRIYNEDTGKDITAEFPLDDRKELLILPKQIGLSEGIFHNTLCIHSLNTKIENSGENAHLVKDFNERIIQLLSSQKEDVSIKTALEVIQGALREIGTEKTPSRLYCKIRDRMEQCKDNINQYAELLDIYLAKELNRKELDDEIASINRKEEEIAFHIYSILSNIIGAKKEDIQRLERSLEAKALLYHRLKKGFASFTGDTFQRFSEKFHTCKENYHELKRKEKVLEQLYSDNRILSDELEPLKGIQQLAVSAETVDELEREISESQEYNLMGYFGEFQKEKNLLIKKYKKRKLISYTIGIGMALTTAAGLFLKPYLFGLMLVWILLFVSSMDGQKRVKKQLYSINEKIEAQERAFYEQQEKKKQLDNQVKKILQAACYDSFISFIHDFRCWQKAEDKMNENRKIIHENEKWITENSDAIFEYDLSLKRYLKELNESFNPNAILDPRALQLLIQRFHEYEKMPGEMQNLNEQIISAKKELDGYYNEQKDWERRWSVQREDVNRKDTRVLHELKEEYNYIREHRGKLDTERAVLASKVKDLEDHLNSYSNAEDEYHLVCGEMDHLIELKGSLEEAAAGLQEIADEYQHDFIPAITNRMKVYLQQFTDGNYKEVKFDNDFHFKTQSVNDPQLIPVENLSNGTIDQIYLAFRIAAGEYLTGKDRLFFIMDDPFIQYDENRRRKTLKALLHLSLRHQLIFFTCHRELDLDLKKGNVPYYIIVL